MVEPQRLVTVILREVVSRGAKVATRAKRMKGVAGNIPGGLDVSMRGMGTKVEQERERLPTETAYFSRGAEKSVTIVI
jgi:hypothetical protein